jgi:hypothetical protein
MRPETGRNPMTVKTATRLFSVIVIAGAVLAGVFFWNSYLQADSGVIDLTKSESLALMDAQSTLVMALSDRDELLRGIFSKYRVNLETHTLNIQLGQLIPIQSEEADEETN